MPVPRAEVGNMRRPSADLSEPSRNLEESNAKPSDGDMDVEIDLTMPPNEEEMLDQENRIYTPPPRIAARFYRPTQARRRDSAASSRRNSMSSIHSIHSRCSSVHDEDQSKHGAHHLRRKSFLEDRRARLADRAAHAEKVRLRAALAKAAPRGQQSEERALAAHQARERNLAEIVANCAEEVRKAKQVAEQTKEKREQEVARMKAKLEERMAAAQKRREELLSKSVSRRSRGSSGSLRKPLDLVSEQERAPLTEDQAAKIIQSGVRKLLGRRRKEVIIDFNTFGLNVDMVKSSPFDYLVMLFRHEKLLEATAKVLRICGLQEGDEGSVTEMAAVRTFLSAYMILGHPHQVLSSKTDDELVADDDSTTPGAQRLPSLDLSNPQIQELISKATEVVSNFETAIASLEDSQPCTVAQSKKRAVSESYAAFFNAFIAWKSRDSNALIEVMLMQFVELDAIYQTVKDSTDDAAAALYKQSIQDSQLMLIVRIKKLAGQEKGKKMIFKAVSEARKARKAVKQTGDPRPRVAENTSDDTAAASSLVSSESHTLTPPATPLNRTESKPVVYKSGLNGLLPDNRVVVHELALNKEYQIPASEYVEQQSLLSAPLYAQMRAALESDDEEARFRFFLIMAANIKEKLQRLVTKGNSLYNFIGEVLDSELAERQFILGNFSYEKFFAAMASLLPKLCAPMRDDEVKNLIETRFANGTLVDRVQALNEFIDTMLCDYINYLLRTAAPKLIESAAQYEAKRFAQDVEQSGMKLTAAEAAWKAAVAKVTAEVQKRDPEGINHPKSQPTASRFYAQLLVDVFTQPTPIDVETVPEMLRLDVSRAQQVSVMIQRIITAGAVLLQCKNLLKRDVRSQWKTEASRIMQVLEANHASIDTTISGTMAALEAGRAMPTATKTHLKALVTKVLHASVDMAKQGTEPREPVLRLLLTRLRGNILVRLAPGSASDKVKAANNAGEKLAALGLSEFVDRVRQISDLLDKIGGVDRAAHSEWWDAVATNVQQDSMEVA